MNRYTIENENECVKRTEMEFFHLNIKPRKEGAAPHVHDLIELLLITNGSFEISCDGSTVHATEGDLVLFRSNHHLRENLLLLGVLFATGFLFGTIFDLTGLAGLLGL